MPSVRSEFLTHHKEMFQKADTDHNGKLSKDEMLAMREKMHKMKEKAGSGEDEIHEGEEPETHKH